MILIAFHLRLNEVFFLQWASEFFIMLVPEFLGKKVPCNEDNQSQPQNDASNDCHAYRFKVFYGVDLFIRHNQSNRILINTNNRVRNTPSIKATLQSPQRCLFIIKSFSSFSYFSFPPKFQGSTLISSSQRFFIFSSSDCCLFSSLLWYMYCFFLFFMYPLLFLIIKLLLFIRAVHSRNYFTGVFSFIWIRKTF